MKRTEKESWESLISANKSGFNTKTPDDLWAKIEVELPKEKPLKKQKVFQIWQVYKYAALFIFALGFGYLAMYLHFTEADETSEATPVKELHVIEQPEYLAELAEVENYYSKEIDTKIIELKEFDNSEEIIRELNLLQDEFEELKAEMGDHINDERIVRAMIQNYRIRLELLKEILQELHPDASKQNIRNYGNTKI